MTFCRIRPWWLSLVLLVSGVCLGQAQFDFEKAEYLEPAPRNRVAVAENARAIGGTLRFDSAKKEVQFLSEAGAVVWSVKYEGIKYLAYQPLLDSNRRVVLFPGRRPPPIRPKAHYLRTIYMDDEAHRVAIIRLDETNVCEALARAEAETRKKVIRPGYPYPPYC